MALDNDRATYSTSDIAKHFGAANDTVLTWIHNGELAAINVARSTATRPRYRVTEEALEAFKRRRAAVTAAPAKDRNRCPGYVPGHVRFV
jgi:excisionase family DNA binding protein